MFTHKLKLTRAAVRAPFASALIAGCAGVLLAGPALADEELRTLVGQAYYLKGDWKGTLHFEEGQVDNVIKEGRTPKGEALQLILSACVKLNDQPCETRALERVVTYYPKPDYWYQLLFTLRQQTSGNDANT